MGFVKRVLFYAAAGLSAAAVFTFMGENVFQFKDNSTARPSLAWQLSHLSKVFSIPDDLIVKTGYCAEIESKLSSKFIVGYRIQIAILESESEAQALVQKVENSSGWKAHIFFREGAWLVRVGDFKGNAEAAEACKTLKIRGYSNAEVLKSPVALAAQGYRIQISAHSSRPAAERIAAIITQDLAISVYVIREKEVWRVQVGDFLEIDECEAFRKKLLDYGFDDAFIVRSKVKAR